MEVNPMGLSVASSDIDIIMVHYHAASLVRDAVAALKDDARQSGLAIQVLVADNGSTGDERRLLQSLDITYLNTGGNLNYPGGVQFAYPHTSARLLVLMNEDVIVLPGCLSALREALENGAAVAGPKFYWDLDRVFLLPCTEERTRQNEFLKAAGRRSVKALKRARDRWRDRARLHWRANTTIPTTAISGALLAFRREAWHTAGPFGAGYFMYFDENDWLSRIERAGLLSVYVPQAEAVHLHNPNLASNADRAQWSSESFLRFGTRHYGETFMRRLYQLGSRPPAIPEWKTLAADDDDGRVEIEIPVTSEGPVWIELSPSPFGYPAATTRITDPATKQWRLPRMTGLPFLTGTFYLQVLDDAGRELGSYSFEHRSAVAPGPSCDRVEALA